MSCVAWPEVDLLSSPSRYLRWQVVDTPGILDHSLVERNTIEMQAITALAHLRAAILYVMDISEQCGHTLEQQVELFASIRPLFANKPIVVALNKVDIISCEELRQDAREMLATFEGDGVPVVPMSTVTEEGVMDVKTRACDELLAQRYEAKIGTLKSKKPEVLNRLHLATPKPRDAVERPPVIPAGAKVKRRTTTASKAVTSSKLVLPKTEEEEQAFYDFKKRYLLSNEDERYDVIPEIFKGKNVADYIDPEIMQRLEELEREEEVREEAGVYNSEPEDPEVLATRKMAVAIRRRKDSLRKQSWEKRARNYPVMPRGKGAAAVVGGTGGGGTRASRKEVGEGMEVVQEGEEADMECDGK